MSMRHLSRLVGRGNSVGNARSTLVFLAFALVALLALIPVIATPRATGREIALVARDMTFYLEGSDVPNPTLTVKRGEEIRVIVRNEDPGITHAFGIASLAASIERISPGATGSLLFRAPTEVGRHDTSVRLTPR